MIRMDASVLRIILVLPVGMPVTVPIRSAQASVANKVEKKSHISLARYLVKNLNDRDLKKHRLSFYIGSILPDCKPSFLYRKHEMTGTFPYVKREIERLSSDCQKKYKRQKAKYYRNLGQVTHYLADYFTFPFFCIHIQINHLLCRCVPR